jgi:hypothetical protein
MQSRKQTNVLLDNPFVLQDHLKLNQDFSSFSVHDFELIQDKFVEGCKLIGAVFITIGFVAFDYQYDALNDHDG